MLDIYKIDKNERFKLYEMVKEYWKYIYSNHSINHKDNLGNFNFEFKDEQGHHYFWLGLDNEKIGFAHVTLDPSEIGIIGAIEHFYIAPRYKRAYGKEFLDKLKEWIKYTSGEGLVGIDLDLKGKQVKDLEMIALAEKAKFKPSEATLRITLF